MAAIRYGKSAANVRGNTAGVRATIWTKSDEHGVDDGGAWAGLIR